MTDYYANFLFQLYIISLQPTLQLRTLCWRSCARCPCFMIQITHCRSVSAMTMMMMTPPFRSSCRKNRFFISPDYFKETFLNYCNNIPEFSKVSASIKYVYFMINWIDCLLSSYHKYFNIMLILFPYIDCSLSKEGKRVIYQVCEYEPLLDSCNMTMTDWARLAFDIDVSPTLKYASLWWVTTFSTKLCILNFCFQD